MLKKKKLSDWISFLAYPNLFGIKGFVLVVKKKKGNNKQKIGGTFWFIPELSTNVPKLSKNNIHASLSKALFFDP
jgi:hypothetical protein